MTRIPQRLRRLTVPATVLSLALALLSGIAPRQGQDVQAQSTLDNLPVFFIAFDGTSTVRSFDSEGNFIDDDTNFGGRFGESGSDIEGLAVDYVTLSGRNNPDGNVIVADADTGNAFAGIGLIKSSGIGFGFFAGFDANDTFVTGNLSTSNDPRPTGLSLGAARDEVVVADPDTGLIDIFQFNEVVSGPPITKINTLDVGFSAGDALALADTDRALSSLALQDEILIADAESGAVRRFGADGESRGQISEADYQPGDGFATGNADGFGDDEFVVGQVATGEIDIFKTSFGSILVDFGTFDAGFETGDKLAMADVTGNGVDEIIMADVSTGEAKIFAYNIYENPDVEGDEFTPYRTLNLGVSAADSFAVLPVRYQDLDNDGIRDDWEREGLDADNDGIVDVDLPGFGASPRHKDLFLELDWESGSEPTRDSVQLMKESFRLAPSQAGGTFNLDQQPGINLWVDTGNLTESGQLVGDSLGGGSSVGSITETICGVDSVFYDVKSQNFDPARAMVFRYGLSASNFGCTGSDRRGGQAEIGGNDLTDFNQDDGTLMHELGHTLGLAHGGGDFRNCKPNYLSIMSYDNQFGIRQTDGGRLIDFSPPRLSDSNDDRGVAPLPTLNEASLNEAQVLDATDAINQTIYSTPSGSKLRSPVNQPIDWNDNGTIDSGTVQSNIDDANGSGNPAACANGDSDSLLFGNDDWGNISLGFRGFSDASDGPIDPVLDPELTLDELHEIQEELNTADLSVDLTTDRSPAVAGEELRYTATMANDGPNPADAVQLTITLPEGIDYQSDDGSCSEDDGVVTCDLGIVPPGEVRTVEVLTSVPADLAASGVSSLTTVVETSNQVEFAQDPDGENNIATLETDLIASADVEILSFELIESVDELLVGEPAEFVLEAIVVNNGPSGPVDVNIDAAAAGDDSLSVSADPGNLTSIDGLDVGEQRTIIERFTLECVAPQQSAATFSIASTPVDAEDNAPENNAASVNVSVECIVPVSINIKPGDAGNLIRVDKPDLATLAILTTAEGEAGLPLAFDATTIDATSVIFGPREALLNSGQPTGATEVHNRGHLEDSFELNEVTKDGDQDMVLHFRSQDSGLDASDFEACVRGSFTTASGATAVFFGCDTIVTQPAAGSDLPA